MNLSTRIDLSVPYAEKEDAKALGARWDVERKLWYAPPGTDLVHLKRWLPRSFALTPADGAVPEPSPAPEKGVSLKELLAQVRGVIEQHLPDAVWVRAEVSELRGRNGHLYLTLAERNERGDVLAQCKAIIWRSRAESVTAKFEEATGEGLRPDIKILCLARVRFDPLFGLDLIVEDVDPSYTLGDLAAKLARIRERLLDEEIYERNRRLPAPIEFVRVAVISPTSSAGLGDFRRETDRLQRAGICDFAFFPATFQGMDAPSSIRAAVNEALAAHRMRRFDVLVIIRGGGSVTDLAWLNDLELARVLCVAPVPVFTGIGHERDSTILDEVAHRRFDTPSKVALHIAATIKDNAQAALAALEQIRLQVARILTRERTALGTQVDRVQDGVYSTLTRAEDDGRNYMTVIRTAARYQLREAAQSLDAGHVRLIGTAEQVACQAGLQAERAVEAIGHRSELLVGERTAAIEKAASAVAALAAAGADAASRELNHLKSQLGRDATRLVSSVAEDVACDRDAVSRGAKTLIEAAARELAANARMIVGLGPQATLRRGFAIVRDDEGRPVTSRAIAVKHTELAVQFHDGSVPVTNRAFENGGA